jgi:hypothetical protein
VSHTHVAMEPNTHAFFAHLTLLREAARDASGDERVHAQVLLIDLYERMLERAGLMVFRDGETEH